MQGARDLPRAHKDDGLAQLLTLWEDHLLKHHHFVDGRGALLQSSTCLTMLPCRPAHCQAVSGHNEEEALAGLWQSLRSEVCSPLDTA